MKYSFAMRFILLIAASGLLLLTSCKDDVIVKPSAKLRLEYPIPNYELTSNDCPYNFAKNDIAELQFKKNCGVNIKYPEMDATLYLTYQVIQNNNLNKLLSDAQKLAYDHTIKADAIPEQPYVNPEDRVFGMFYPIDGNAATQAHFYVTDSLSHFITGSLYFDTKPNFDSIFPAVVYLRQDIRTIMESLTWESETE